MRLLGIDVGARRTGVALSDPLGIICSPLEVIEEADRDSVIDRIVELAQLHEVEQLVVGLPRPLSGGTNSQIEQVLEFVAALEVRSQMRVKTWDERFTSKLAGEPQRAAGARDSVAACYILQNYLDAQANVRGER